MNEQGVSAIVRKLSAFVVLMQEEQSVVDGLCRHPRLIRAGQDLVVQGQTRHSAYILQSGWVCSYKLQEDGSRQIIDFQVPGDFLGLRSVLLRTSDHSFESVTDIQVSEVQTADLIAAFECAPRLSAAIFWAVSRDEAMVVEHLVGVGRRGADSRVAHFLLELETRLALIGLSNRRCFRCPLTQYHLADALGLSAVHVNRVLRHLREAGLVTFRHGFVSIHDPVALADIAGFDATYLDQAEPLLR